jgi:uncharacterized protein (TIGR00290 family)
MKEKVIFCWSGGKDSALALHKIIEEGKCEIVALLTTLNETFKRVSMHGVREELLVMQANSIGLPLIKMYVSEGTNSEYEKNIELLLLKYKNEGVSKVIFGDIFLEDLREYRENNLRKVGLTAEFPLWKKNTSDLIREFLSLGFKTKICCTNDAYLNEESVGEEITNDFIEGLPGNIDPCGENGEYHTFCYDGPIFKTTIKFTVGEKIYKPLEIKTTNILNENQTKGFWFVDLIPED